MITFFALSGSIVDYILHLYTCIIILVNEELKKLATNNLEFDKHKIIILSGKDISLTKDYKEQEFQDHILIEKFDSLNTHLALNKALKSITKLTIIHSLIFKPLLAVILCLSITLATLQYQTIIIQSDTKKLNKRYYSLSEDYREIQRQNPELANISDLVDLYNLENMIKNKSILPFTSLKTLLPYNREELQIININWKISAPEMITTEQPTLTINVSLIYKGDAKSTVDGIEIINEYINHIKSTFYDYTINYDLGDILNISQKISIPAEITITGKIKNKNDAR